MRSAASSSAAPSRFEGYTGGGGKEEIGGLLSSGDVGHFDDHGRLFIDGRDDDMIVSGGENVFPREVEDLLAAHPASPRSPSSASTTSSSASASTPSSSSGPAPS